MLDMRRRVFLTLLGGAAAALPLAARAQQPDRMRRIGVLMNSAADDPESQVRLVAFVQELQRLGWITDRNVQIEARWSAADVSTLARHATELAALAPDAILAGVGGTVAPLLQATRTVPIVFAQSIDPVGTGFVASLARISHPTKCIGAPNRRKLLCSNDFRAIRGAPRCRQSVAQICSNLHPLRGAK